MTTDAVNAREGTITSIQEAVASMFGLTVEELKGGSNRHVVAATPNRDVPSQVDDRCITTRDRTSLRRQAPHNRHALDSENPRAEKQRS